MKKNTFIALCLLLICSCQKDQPAPQEPIQAQAKKTGQITIEEAMAWLAAQPASPVLSRHPINWEEARDIPTKDGNRIAIAIPGSPTYQNIRQGFRQLSIERNRNTKEIGAKFLEVIPDGIYLQTKRKSDHRDFTGRIIEYDLNYHLLGGRIYSGGKQTGELRPATTAEKTAYLNPGGQMRPLASFEQFSSAHPNGKIARAMVIETCAWYQTTYVDAEGVFTVYSERLCSYSFYDGGGGGDGGGYSDPGTGGDGGTQGGSGGSTGNSGAPAPSELPGEAQPSVNAKKMMDCFSSITTPNAAYQVKVLVQEPLPGTFFNIGPNAFGHVAIQLTKAGDNQIITQTVGFYPTGTGLDKLVSRSRMIDNGGLEYNISATYWTNAQDFQKLIDYVSSPPKNYHFTDFNCAAFVYQAGRAGNIPIPDPTTQIGFAGPGGAGTAMTPQGMAQALSQQKANNPSTDISSASGRVPASKGECN